MALNPASQASRTLALNMTLLAQNELDGFGGIGVFGFKRFSFPVPNATKFPGVEERCPVDVIHKFA